MHKRQRRNILFFYVNLRYALNERHVKMWLFYLFQVSNVDRLRRENKLPVERNLKQPKGIVNMYYFLC